METIIPIHDDALYDAILSRDSRFEGRFFVGVTSTGISFRPVCRVRTPHRKNCRYFPNAPLAEEAGVRPCLRGRPERALAGTMGRPWARFREETEAAMGCSWRDARPTRDWPRLRRSLNSLAILCHAPPLAHAFERKRAMILLSRHATPLGVVLLASNGTHLTGAWFEGQRHIPAFDPAHVRFDEGLTLFEEARSQFNDYFSGLSRAFNLPLHRAGTPFQRSVWDALATIPYGAVETYAGLARRLNAPTAARAVGSAVGRNPLSVIVPCHRVIGGDGSLTGYAGGLERKRALLRLEGYA